MMLKKNLQSFIIYKNDIHNWQYITMKLEQTIYRKVINY
jgi:hypothetical protein